MWWLYLIGLILTSACSIWVFRVGEREIFIHRDTEKGVEDRVNEAVWNLLLLFGVVSWVMVGGIFNWWDL